VLISGHTRGWRALYVWIWRLWWWAWSGNSRRDTSNKCVCGVWIWRLWWWAWSGNSRRDTSNKRVCITRACYACTNRQQLCRPGDRIWNTLKSHVVHHERSGSLSVYSHPADESLQLEHVLSVCFCSSGTLSSVRNMSSIISFIKEFFSFVGSIHSLLYYM